MEKTNYTLGIDVGVGSVGIALIDQEKKTQRIIDGTARIFPASTGAVERRESRSARTQNKRKRARLEKLKSLLIEDLNVDPSIFDKEKNFARTSEEGETKKSSSIVALRAKAVSERVNPEELARATYHIAKNRGIRLTRVTADSETAAAQKKENTVSGKANAEMHKVMSDHDLETVGQYLAWRENQGYPIKARRDALDRLDFFIKRDDTKNELDLILKEQSGHHASLTEEVRNKIFDTVFWEKESPNPAEKVGLCAYTHLNNDKVGQDKRLPVISPIFQKKRLLEELNNIRIRNNTGELRNGDGLLSREERDLILEKIQRAKASKAEQIRKAGKLPAECILSIERSYQRNNKAGTERTLSGDASFLAIKGTVLEEGWFERSLIEREDIIETLRTEEDPEQTRQKISDILPDLEEEELDALLDLTFLSGYSAAGLTATSMLLDQLKEEVISLFDAEKRSGLSHKTAATGEILDRLPYYGTVLEHYCAGGTHHPADPIETQYGRIANPVVHQSLNQIRKIVNSVIKKYGPPATVHIELSRDMNKSQEERDKLARENTKNQKMNEDYDQTIREHGKRPSRKYRRALKLHAFQSGICPYTGRQMSIADIFNGSTDLDHILPRSKTLQDSLNNLVLCDAAANKFKGDRSPYDAFHPHYRGVTANGEAVDLDYDQILTLIENSPPGKKWRFNGDAMDRFQDQEGMLDRFKGDTSYLGKVAKQYLTFLVGDPAKVVVLTGGITSDLRYHWGVHNLLQTDQNDEKTKKDRSDHRHHLIDALVIACTSRSEILRLQNWAGKKDTRTDKMDPVRLEPWPGFREEVAKFNADQGRVTQKPDRNVNRKLHKETAYRLIAEEASGVHIITLKNPLSSLLGSTQKGEAVFDALIPKENILPKIRDIAEGKGRFFGNATQPVQHFEEICRDLAQMRSELIVLYRSAPETKEVTLAATKTKPEEIITKKMSDKEKIAYAIDRYQHQTGRRQYRSFDTKGLNIIRGPVSDRTDRPQGAYHARSNSRVDLFVTGALDYGWEVVQTLDEKRETPASWRSDPEAQLIYSLRQKDELEMWDSTDEENRKRIIVRVQNISVDGMLFFPVEKSGNQNADPGAIRIRSTKKYWQHDPVKLIRDPLGTIRFREERGRKNR